MPIKEDHPVEPDSPYGCTKLCEEKLCLSYARLYPMEAVCLRYFNVYGPNQRFDAYGNAIPIFVFRMLRKEPLMIYGDGEQTRDFVHVDDVVQANIHAADAIGVSGAFNIASGTRVTINRLVEMITKNSSHPVSIEHGPERPGDVRHSLADISMAHERIKYAPVVDLESGLEEYVEWAHQIHLNSK
jgi:UDP-glucose 4-epimerase